MGEGGARPEHGTWQRLWRRQLQSQTEHAIRWVGGAGGHRSRTQ